MVTSFDEIASSLFFVTRSGLIEEPLESEDGASAASLNECALSDGGKLEIESDIPFTLSGRKEKASCLPRTTLNRCSGERHKEKTV